jgi:HEAT repeat protein
MQSFWDRLQSHAVEKIAMKAVFSLESEPAYRLKAIENLSKFKSMAVVEALIDLLWDKDPNIRAIAAISVAKSGYDKSSRRSGTDKSANIEDVDDLLTGLLSDKDRLVRESACIALGHRQCQKVVPSLLHLWRNDNISSVREAAQAALQNIGGDEANRALHMTTILQQEMKSLKI